MISIDRALELYARNVAPLPTARLPLDGSLHRVLAEDATSRIDLPPFVQSSMDGYALRSADARVASTEQAARLRLVGVVPAGTLHSVPELAAGEAARIYTGGHVPTGADAVIRQEEAHLDGTELVLSRPVPAGDYVRYRGEELAAGSVIARAGTRITPGLMGAMAVAGIGDVQVYVEPKIAVLTTGDEVVPPGRDLAIGEIYDGNAPLVTAWLGANGYRRVFAEHLPDDLDRTTTAIDGPLDKADLVIVAGGVSVGDRDFVPPAARRARAEEVFWRVAQLPGKPLLFSRRGSTPLLGLPGNPGAVFVCLAVHVRRVLDLLEGVSKPQPGFSAGVLDFPVARNESRDQWARCQTQIASDGTVRLTALPHQASHMISNLAHCTALARIPAGDGELQAGATVSWTACGDYTGTG